MYPQEVRSGVPTVVSSLTLTVCTLYGAEALGLAPLLSCCDSICFGGGYILRLMAAQWLHDTCRREWQRVSSQLGFLTTTTITLVVGTLPRLMGGLILLRWNGTCSLQLAGNLGQGVNLSGFCPEALCGAGAHKPSSTVQWFVVKQASIGTNT